MVIGTKPLYTAPSDWLDMPPPSSKAPRYPIYDLKARQLHSDMTGLSRDPSAQLQLPKLRKL